MIETDVNNNNDDGDGGGGDGGSMIHALIPQVVCVDYVIAIIQSFNRLKQLNKCYTCVCVW